MMPDAPSELQQATPTVTMKMDGPKLNIELHNCLPPQAVDMLLKAIRAIIFQKPADTKPNLLVPNGQPIPNLRSFHA